VQARKTEGEVKKVTTSFILGAGLGTRLRPYTEKLPKPLLPVEGRPLIEYALDHCIEAGIERFIINTHHCPEEYEKAFPEASYRGCPIDFRYEPVLLETAGGLKNVEDLLSPDESVLLYNGDILTDLSLAPLLEFHHWTESESTLALRSSGPVQNVTVDTDSGQLLDLRQTLLPDQTPNAGYTGICVVAPAFLERIEKDKVESLVPIWLQAINDGASIHGIVLDDGEWNDVGTVEVYEALK